MKFVPNRPYSDPERAARKIVEIANSIEPGQDGRIYIELINGPFLYREKGTQEEYIWRSSAAGWSWTGAEPSSGSHKRAPTCSPEPSCDDVLPKPAGTFLSGYRRKLPISEVIEPGPFVDRSAAHTAPKVAGVSSPLHFLASRVNSRAVRAGEMDDQLEIVAHAPMMP